MDLTCTIADGKEYPILWIRKDASGAGFPISTGPNLLIPDKKFALKNSEKNGTYTLSVKDIQPSDAATYQCQVVVSLSNRLTADVLLEVRTPIALAWNKIGSHYQLIYVFEFFR